MGECCICLGLPKENKTADITGDAATKWEKDKKRSVACFETMKQYHLDILEAVHTPSAAALKRFFTTWNPETAENHSVLKPYLTTNLLTANVMYAVEGSLFKMMKPSGAPGMLIITTI